MRATPYIAGAALALALGACTAPAPTAEAPAPPRCDVLMAEGATITGIAMLNTVCAAEDGSSHLYGAAHIDCTDGRTLVWNDRGWGYIGGPFHVHPAGTDPHVAPDTELRACRP